MSEVALSTEDLYVCSYMTVFIIASVCLKICIPYYIVFQVSETLLFHWKNFPIILPDSITEKRANAATGDGDEYTVSSCWCFIYFTVPKHVFALLVTYNFRYKI